MPQPKTKKESPTKQDNNHEIKMLKISTWQAIIVTLITAASSIFVGYFAIPHKENPLSTQGLSQISLEGKWKYVCTSFDGDYEHGGRFYVQKNEDGTLILHGERMWRDQIQRGRWLCRNFNETDWVQWHTNWIYVLKNKQINFEYQMNMKDKTVLGYCSGIIYSEKDVITHVKGNFYVLSNSPILTGQIIFKKVSDDEYNSETSLKKNHICSSWVDFN